MRLALLDFLVCPACGGRLTVEKGVPHNDGHIEEGALRCACGAEYAIAGGVPRMLVGAVREERSIDRQTQASFGYEWTRFSAMRPEWEKNFWHYLQPHTPDSLQGKVILDAGCGMGRHLYHASRCGKTVIGVDFSGAVEVAYANTREFPNAHVVQADLRQLPFPPAVFDLVYCLGVLHHIADPDAALERLMSHLKTGGEARVYVYWDLADAPAWKRSLLAGVNRVRRITTALPHPLLHGLCYPIAAAAWLTFVLPYRALSRLRWTRRFAETLPLTQYAQYPFGVLLNDQFDRFSAPLERRYSAQQVRTWLEAVGLNDVRVAPNWGWLGFGTKSHSCAA
jgi:SAM-dependent methyltransferase